MELVILFPSDSSYIDNENLLLKIDANGKYEQIKGSGKV